MVKISFLLVLSILLGLTANTVWPGDSYQEQLIRLQAAKEVGGIVETLDDQSIEIQAVLLDYSADRVLVLKTALALLKYPEKTQKVLQCYGSDPLFKEVLSEYGEAVIPVIHYFLTSKIKPSIKLIHNAGQAAIALQHWWNGGASNIEVKQTLEPAQQGWYAILFIKNEGYDFLGQFVIDEAGQVKWIQTERVTEGFSAFFTSGIRELETRYRTDQEISSNELLWAGVDVLAVAGTLKLLRAGRQAARAGRSISLTRQTTVFGSRLLRSGMAVRLLKYSSIAATAWVVVSHPSLIVSLFAEVGRLAGIAPPLMQLAGVSLMAFILLYPVLWLAKWLMSARIIVNRRDD